MQDPVKIMATVVVTEYADLILDFYYELTDFNPVG
eukprot:COSAG03_NODE_598_length_6798_cov_39.483654_8_plen_35_part_00